MTEPVNKGLVETCIDLIRELLAWLGSVHPAVAVAFIVCILGPLWWRSDVSNWFTEHSLVKRLTGRG